MGIQVRKSEENLKITIILVFRPMTTQGKRDRSPRLFFLLREHLKIGLIVLIDVRFRVDRTRKIMVKTRYGVIPQTVITHTKLDSRNKSIAVRQKKSPALVVPWGGKRVLIPLNCLFIPAFLKKSPTDVTACFRARKAIGKAVEQPV